MKLYTVQNLKAWIKSQELGYLTGNDEYIDEDFKPAYNWMKEQMKNKLRNYNEETPIWLWLDVNNINIGELLNDEYVILEVKLDESEVLLSNFIVWHNVLNGWHVDETYDMTIEESWELIFDFEELEEMGYDIDDISNVQGVTHKINLKDITKIKYMVNNINNA